MLYDKGKYHEPNPVFTTPFAPASKLPKRFRDRGKTAEASDLNQLTITEAIIEILAALEEIADSLKAIADQAA